MSAASDQDLRWMDMALMLARRGLGTTAPNPSVGAVIVDPATDTLIARGWTQPGGRPHAEVEALARAGADARGATMYVTLEPCSHFGRTPPCADAVIAAGITRLVVGVRDPDPRVAGRGLKRCVEAGIAVRSGVRAAEAHRVTLGHILRVTERRPLVLVKMAVDAAGGVPRGAGGRPVWVTGTAARADGHMLRAEADAILVGTRTLADDDPDLGCRLPGLALQSPVRVVLAGRHLPAPARRVVATARVLPTWIVHPAGGDRQGAAQLEAAGCRLIGAAAVEDRVWLPALLEAMVEEGVTRLLVEGGPTVWRAFLSAGLADEIVVYQAPPAEGDAAAQAEAIVEAHGGRSYRLEATRPVGADMRHVLVRK
ncbi:MAG: bifunctional diaminohydroxyphosphoribosylaminopyrimidine deaminase/5-amino-6-(5-phosphoribosylamino)uracil reductase RibD [Hyphomicrobiaceae bacterium]